MSLLEYQALTIEGRDYEAAYSDYWNSTTDEDGKWQDLSSGVVPFLSDTKIQAKLLMRS
jgi:hypothetical protein